MCIMKICNLSIEDQTLPGQPLLDRVGLTLQTAQITGLLGESGCGKTLLAKSSVFMLPDNLIQTGGVIVFKGQTLNQGNITGLRGKYIFYSPQNARSALNPLTSLRRQSRILLKNRFCRLGTTLKNLAIKDPERLICAYPHQLSEGEIQRYLLGMALVLKPDLLILDEPASSLDEKSKHDFIHLVRKIKYHSSMTILLISHHLQLIRSLADHVYIMGERKILEHGPLQSILTAPGHPYTKSIVETEHLTDAQQGITPGPDNFDGQGLCLYNRDSG